jgi:hypothetical protein
MCLSLPILARQLRAATNVAGHGASRGSMADDTHEDRLPVLAGSATKRGAYCTL